MPRRIAPSRFRDSLSLAVGGLFVILSGCQGGGNKTAGGTPALTSIAVTPANSLLPEGMTQQMKATGTNSDGSMVDLTATASWSSSTTSVATINTAGLADGVGIGSSTIRATHGSVMGTTTLNVNPTVLSQVIQHVVIIFAIGNSAYWSNTAIFITWDDWGGWFDHVPPPSIISSYEYGFRVPLIVVSPYAKRGYVSHVNHDFGSILKFIEELFKLPSLGFADSLADDLSDCFDLTQVPPPFTAIPAAVSPQQFLSDKRPATAPDDDDQ